MMRKKPPHELSGQVVGDATCECGITIPCKVAANGFLYLKCKAHWDGGCTMDKMARSEKSSTIIARQVVKWRKPEFKAHFLAGASLAPELGPEKVPDPKPPAKPPTEKKPVAPAPEPSPAPKKKTTDEELFG